MVNDKPSDAAGMPVKANGQPPAPKAADSGAKEARRAAARSLQEPRGWVIGMRAAFRKFLIIAAVVVVWCFIIGMGIVSRQSAGPINIILSTILFVLAIPAGLAIGLDKIMTWAAAYDPVIGLLLSTAVVCVNFLMIGAVRGALSGGSSKKKPAGR